MGGPTNHPNICLTLGNISVDYKICPSNRKKILKRSSKIELEAPLDLESTGKSSEVLNESKLGLFNQENGIVKVCTSNATGNGSVKKTKPILKRSEHFEVSVDKNAVLRKSDSVKKVLHKDMNICGKLLQIQSYNEISFDSSFKPVHR